MLLYCKIHVESVKALAMQYEAVSKAIEGVLTPWGAAGEQVMVMWTW